MADTDPPDIDNSDLKFFSLYGAALFMLKAPRFWVSALVLCTSVYIYIVHENVAETGFSNLDADEFRHNLHPRIGFSSLEERNLDNHTFSGRIAGSIYHPDHDPRLIPALWLHRLSTRLESVEFSDFDSFSGNSSVYSVPFNWQTFLGINASPGKDGAYLNCSCLEASSANSRKSSKPPHNTENLTNDFSLDIVTGPIDSPLSAEMRNCIGANYMLNSHHLPSKVVLLDASQEGNENNSSKIHILNVHQDKFSTATRGLIDEYLKQTAGPPQVSISKELRNFRRIFTETYQSKVKNENHPLGNISHNLTTSIDLQLEQFDSAPGSRTSGFDPFKTMNTDKYFHEAELCDNHAGFHHDWRFFKKSEFSSYERKVILHRMSRAWLRFSHSANLTTWLAHGTLLGWYWNGMNLPWDQDIDVQMTYQSLEDLVSYNQSLVIDLTDDPDIACVHSYFIDVSPYYNNRHSGDSNNVVDARFIDTDTGMYVDITALAISEDPKVAVSGNFGNLDASQISGNSSEIFNKTEKGLVRLHKVFDEDYADKLKSGEADASYMSQYHVTLAIQEVSALKARNLLKCKDFHFYQFEEIGPLVRTSFEGEIAWVPRDFKNILRREYPKGLTSRVYGNWIYRPFFGLWTPLSVCSRDFHGDKCTDRDTVLEEQQARSYRLEKGHWDAKISKNSRVDPFILQRNRNLNAGK